MRAATPERWPPVYDADDLVREIKQLTARPDLGEVFYDWRLDRSTRAVEDVCQGDVVHLPSEIPLLASDGQPEVMEHPTGAWLVLGNTCDFDRAEAQWTQLVPLSDLGAAAEMSPHEYAALRRYTAYRSFYLPPWSASVSQRVHAADFQRTVAVDKRALGLRAPGPVQARMGRPAWILLNACVVRFLARDDGRYV